VRPFWRSATRVWPLLLGGILLAGCHDGDHHGLGTACDPSSGCRLPLVCVAGVCALPDAAVDTSTETSSDVSADTTNDRDSAMKSDGESEAPIDAVLDGADGGSTDVIDGASDTSSSDTAGDASDGPVTDASDDAADGGEPDGPSPDGMKMDTAPPDSGAAADGGPKGDPNHPPVIHVFATTQNRRLWLMSAPLGSLHGPENRTTAPLDVSARAGSIGPIDDVEAQSIENELNALARQGSDVFATSVIDQNWTPWLKVGTGVRAMALANVRGQLWACLAGSTGRLRLMVRQSVGWQDLGDVMDEASVPANAPTALSKLDCVGMGDDLEIFALDDRSHLWRATKTGTGWVPFREVTDAIARGIMDIDVANAAGELHVLGSTRTTQYHGIIDTDGKWSGLDDVESINGDDPGGEVVAGATTSLLTEVDLIEILNDGAIWINPRFRFTLAGYAKFAERAPDDSRFVTATATSVLPY
jgi:hypothetical protein